MAQLQTMGFGVRVVDSPAAPEAYYLAVPPPPSGTMPALEGYGTRFEYTPQAFILKAGRAAAERLSGAGVGLQKLDGPVPLPAPSPAEHALAAQAAAAPQADPAIQTLVDSVSQTEIYSTILHLQDDDSTPLWDADRTRYAYSAGVAVERDYIQTKMTALGLQTRLQNFNYGGHSLDNIEGTLPGWDPHSDTVYLAVAHYDSITVNSGSNPESAAPGADDNASGVAAVLEAARVLSQNRYRYTLKFVAFSAEELGLIGSGRYAAQARAAGTPIGGVINHDMVAWDGDGDGAMDLHVGTRSDSQALGLVYSNTLATYGIALNLQYIIIGATNRSDHASFWSQNYPALLAIEDFADSQDFNPYYHTPGDTLDKLDMGYARKFAQATVAGLAQLAGVIPPGLNIALTGPQTITAAEVISYSLYYGNPGPNPATGVVITATLSPYLTYLGDNGTLTVAHPAGNVVVWQANEAISYTQHTFVITASAAADLPAGASVTVSAEITGATPSDDPADNRAVWTVAAPGPRVYLPLIAK
ncbi:MAG: M20/M25/M40 family metallo-hydrolase [Anaerolineae bacterium]